MTDQKTPLDVLTRASFHPLSGFPAQFGGASRRQDLDENGEIVPGTLNKILIDATTGKDYGRQGSSTEKTGICDFATALEWLKTHDGKTLDRTIGGKRVRDEFYSIAFMLYADDPWVCIDLDHCRGEDGQLTPLAKDLTSGLLMGNREKFYTQGFRHDAYMEWSQSGNGIHIFCQVDPATKQMMLPPVKGYIEYGGVRQDIEIYAEKHQIMLGCNQIDDLTPKFMENAAKDSVKGCNRQRLVWLREHVVAKERPNAKKAEAVAASATPMAGDPVEFWESDYYEKAVEQAAATLDKILREDEPVQEGDRDDDLTVKSRMLINDLLLKREDALDAALAFNQERYAPPLPESQVQKCVGSAWRSRNPHGSKVRGLLEALAAEKEKPDAEEDLVGDREEEGTDEYGYGGKEYEEALAGLKEVVAGTIGGERPWLCRAAETMQWQETRSDFQMPIQYCVSDLIYVMSCCLTNNKFVKQGQGDAPSSTDPDADPDAQPWKKLKIVLKTGEGKKRAALQVNVMNVGTLGAGKDSGKDMWDDYLRSFGKKAYDSDASNEGFVQEAAKNNNNDVTLYCSEASDIFDVKSWRHKLISLLTAAFQKGRLTQLRSKSHSKSSNDPVEAYFCYPSTLSSVQPEIIQRQLKKTDLLQGFYRRIIFCHAEKRIPTKQELNATLRKIANYPQWEQIKDGLLRELHGISENDWAVELGPFPSAIKHRMLTKSGFGPGTPQYAYIETFCDLFLPIIAFCLNPAQDLSDSRAQKTKETWEAAEKMSRFFIICALQTFALADTYDHEGHQESELRGKVLKAIREILGSRKGKKMQTKDIWRLRRNLNGYGREKILKAVDSLREEDFIKWDKPLRGYGTIELK